MIFKGQVLSALAAVAVGVMAQPVSTARAGVSGIAQS